MARAGIAVGVLALLVWRVGAGAFVNGLRRVDVVSLLVALALNAVSTVACAARWRTVSAALGADLALRQAVPAYYRAQFLNTALPGGVLGDVNRGMRQGRELADVGRGVRAVVWERGIGQVVQALVTTVILLAAAPALRSAGPIIVLAAGAVGLAGWGLIRLTRPRWLPGLRQEARSVLARRRLPVLAATSLVVVAAHVTTFIVAARTAGADASVARLVPLALLILLAMAVPLNLGGWGPREGVAAWAFAAAGLGAAQGVAAATVYGVLVVAASLPGAAVMIVPRRGRPVPSAPPPPTRVGSARA
jgi:uncharacterized membrane protein YbhN (UPF0104 family)